MSTHNRLTEVFHAAQEIPFDDSSRFVLFSDCHRGDNGWADDFAHNQILFFNALNHYYKEGFIYIELGDGDELWENRSFLKIRGAHSHVFWLMSKFYAEQRFYLLFGNHDLERMTPGMIERTLYRYYDERDQTIKGLFNGIQVHEGLVLRHSGTDQKIFLVHGHQGDLMGDRLWRLGRFFVRYFWKHLQLIGVRDPTSPAKNFRKQVKVEKKIIEWVQAEDQMLIAGHTHRSRFPTAGEPPYFNDGSCVHPRCITGIEIQDGEIVLIKWWVKAEELEPRGEDVLVCRREVIAGPTKLTSFR